MTHAHRSVLYTINTSDSFSIKQTSELQKLYNVIAIYAIYREKIAKCTLNEF